MHNFESEPTVKEYPYDFTDVVKRSRESQSE
jgi:hypothetical protein